MCWTMKVESSYTCYSIFFQAEGGMRDIGVTGVQTCALPILIGAQDVGQRLPNRRHVGIDLFVEVARQEAQALAGLDRGPGDDRSEERRVGKERRSRWSPYH